MTTLLLDQRQTDAVTDVLRAACLIERWADNVLLAVDQSVEIPTEMFDELLDALERCRMAGVAVPEG